MSLLSWLPLAASTLFSEKVPTLSEPLMIKIPAGTTLNAGYDSVGVGSLGLAQGFFRTNAGIRLVREKRSDTLNLVTPNLTLRGVYSFGNALWTLGDLWAVTPSSPLSGYQFTRYDPYVDMGGGYSSWHSYLSTGYSRQVSRVNLSQVPNPPSVIYPETYSLACGEKAIYWLKIDSSHLFSVTQTFPVTGAGHPLCDVVSWMRPDSFVTVSNDLELRYNSHKTKIVLQWPLPGGHWAIKTGEINMTNPGKGYDSLRVKGFDWMLLRDSLGHWLSFDQSQAKLFWRSGDPSGPFQVDSLAIPGLTKEKRPCYQVTRVDSLVVFAVDSQIVFLKWTPQKVEVTAKYSIPGKVIQAVTLPTALQKLVWATTGTELYSFKFSMEEPPVSSASPKPSRSALFSIQPREGGATFSWYGFETETVHLTGIDGRSHGVVKLAPGATVDWAAPHPGMYLARTPDGVKRILAR